MEKKGFDKFMDSVKDGLEKVGDKVIEVKNSEKTKEFVEKAKDVAISVGVKVTDVGEELGNRAKDAMHNVADKHEAAKCSAEETPADSAGSESSEEASSENAAPSEAAGASTEDSTENAKPEE